jgi:hypothetical protein
MSTCVELPKPYSLPAIVYQGEDAVEVYELVPGPEKSANGTQAALANSVLFT